MAKNTDLNKAKKNDQDEFYTMMPEIDAEARYYRKHFKNATIFCNCDDPFESNFFRHFALNFNRYGLKKLVATCYSGSPIAGEQLTISDFLEGEIKPKKPAYKIEINEVSDVNNDGSVDLADVEWLIKNKKNTLQILDGDGSFESPECQEILDDPDLIVCTNPPFSKFIPFINLLNERVSEGRIKGYLIIGHVNAVKYKDVFPLMKENKLWMGKSIHSGDRWFRVPDSYPLTGANTKIEDGKKYVKVKGVRWFTNLDYDERHEDLDLYKKYSELEFPMMDTYPAVSVGKSKDIPRDMPLDTIFAVPITFLDKHNPDQFEIIGELNHGCDNKYDYAKPILGGKELFPRILIRRLR